MAYILFKINKKLVTVNAMHVNWYNMLYITVHIIAES